MTIWLVDYRIGIYIDGVEEKRCQKGLEAYKHHFNSCVMRSIVFCLT